MHRVFLFALAVACASSPARSSIVSKTVPILDTTIAYREVGSGPPIVFLHGNPTSSYVWREVMAALADRGRLLAPDLVGMGQSGKPESAYRFADHVRYLDAWFAKQDLRDVVLVGYDWGGVLALDWARRNPDRVRGVVVFETFLRPMHWSDWSGEGAKLFRALRTPRVGEQMVLEQNAFLARSLEHGVQRGLTSAEREVYYAPYPDPGSRRPMLQWPREIPIDGEPADVVEIVERNGAWLAGGARPALLLTFEGSGLTQPALVQWVRSAFPKLAVVALPRAGHHAPEDAPVEIARAIRAWLDAM